ncbi:hypothetical protein [Clostridium thailandense]|uniref:hypothetical protein n=1 Tax=Clostridium thailandense TaxID=2794346 RepID=UPI003989506F
MKVYKITRSDINEKNSIIRQYTNCSLVNFDMDWDKTSDSASEQSHHSYFKLFIGQEYNCQMENGGGSEGYNTFVVN